MIYFMTAEKCGQHLAVVLHVAAYIIKQWMDDVTNVPYRSATAPKGQNVDPEGSTWHTTI